MKLKRFTAAIAAAALLSGCSAASVEELLSPPRLNEEQSQIYDALKSCTKKDINLKYPKSGQYRSAFVVKNIDGEETDEAIVFYESANISDGSSLRINFLDKEDGKWVSVYDLAADGNEVEKVMFSDLGNGRTSVIVTFLLQNSSDKALSVISYDNQPEEVFSTRHTYMDVFDADGDGTNEIFTITTDRAQGTAEAATYSCKSGSFAETAQTMLAGPAEYRNIFCGKNEKGGNAIFIDYSLSGGINGTQALLSDGGRLKQSDAYEIINRRTNSYTPSMFSTDIDGDGITEIASTVPFPNYEKLSPAEQVNMTVWYSLGDNGHISRKYSAFMGTKGDYMMILPKKYESNITAAVSLTESSVTFCTYDKQNDSAGEPLFAIYGAADSDKYKNSGYTLLGTSEATGWSYYAKTLSSRSPSEKELKELFTAL